MKMCYLFIPDTITGKVCKVEVSEQFYKEYNRMEWKSDKKEKEYRRHCTPFTALKGTIENFKEFLNNDDPVEKTYTDMQFEKIFKAISRLTTAEKKLLYALYFEGKTERRYCIEANISQSTLHYKKQAVLRKLHKLIK